MEVIGFLDYPFFKSLLPFILLLLPTLFSSATSIEKDVVYYCKYLRYSRADGDKETESIANQNRIIDAYVKERLKKGEKWVLVDTYCDINYTGLNFKRPDFLRMKKDIEAKKINVVISKDLSRFGRSTACEDYFTEIFPKYGTFFIGAVCNTDTSDDKNILQRQIHGIFNEQYCRDISSKVKSSLRIKMAEGKYVGSSVPYGFLRDPSDKHQLIVDGEVRPIILRIAKLYLEGNGLQTISRLLNDGEKDENGNLIYAPVPCPIVYKKNRGINAFIPNTFKEKWSASTVKKIISDETYNGTLVQHKTEKVAIKTSIRSKIDECEQIRVEGALEKIFDDETWDLIQRRSKMRSKAVKNSYTNEVLPGNYFSHLIFCEDCGSMMVYRGDRGVYACGTYSNHGKHHCTNHYIKRNYVTEVVLNQLQLYNKITVEIKEMVTEIRKINKHQDITNVVRIKTQQHQKRFEKIKVSLKLLREEYATNYISEEEYRTNREEYMQEIEEVEKELGLLNNKAKNSQTVDNEWEKRITDIEKTYEKYFEIKEINREIALMLVNKIVVNKDGEVVEIVFNGESPIAIAEELQQELNALAM